MKRTFDPNRRVFYSVMEVIELVLSAWEGLSDDSIIGCFRSNLPDALEYYFEENRDDMDNEA